LANSAIAQAYPPTSSRFSPFRIILTYEGKTPVTYPETIYPEAQLMIAIQKVPNVTFKTRVRDETVEGPNPFRWQDMTTQDIFGGKRVVVFSLPGAFTPTCSTSHLPRYEELYDEFVALGVDQIICISVNDAFVMFQWGKNIGADRVFLLPDGNGEFTRKMGMLVDKANLGFGMRSWRYSMVVNDGAIEKMFIESEYGDNCPTDPFEVSDADTMLAYLKSAKAS
jgi:thioredoxin-dependent peroxiredoxin